MTITITAPELYGGIDVIDWNKTIDYASIKIYPLVKTRGRGTLYLTLQNGQ